MSEVVKRDKSLKIERFDSISTIESDQLDNLCGDNCGGALFALVDEDDDDDDEGTDCENLIEEKNTKPILSSTSSSAMSSKKVLEETVTTPNSGNNKPDGLRLNTGVINRKFGDDDDDIGGPLSAPIGSKKNPSSPHTEYELLNRAPFIQSKSGAGGGGGHDPVTRLRSVSFQRGKMAFPKAETGAAGGGGYRNLAYENDDDDNDAENYWNDNYDGNVDDNDADGGGETDKQTVIDNPAKASAPGYQPVPEVDEMWPTNESPAEREKSVPDSGEDVGKSWDRFETLPPPDEDETVDSEWIKISIQWLKIAAYIFTFAVVLTASVASKCMTLLMTSMISVNHSVTICNLDRSYISHPPLEHDKVYRTQYAADDVHRVAWLWCLYFAIVAPYVFGWLRAIRIVYFKSGTASSYATFATVFLMETLHCIGLSILMFVVLPEIDVTKGAMMMNTVCTVPSLLRLFIAPPADDIARKASAAAASVAKFPPKKFQQQYAENKMEASDRRHLGTVTNRKIAYVSFLLQIAGILAWTLIGYEERNHFPRFYLIPVALIFVSFEWWENYIVPKRMHRWLRFLENARNDLEENRSRYFVSCFTMLWKAGLIFAFMMLTEVASGRTDFAKMMFQNFTDGFHAETVPVIRLKNGGQLLEKDRHELYVENTLWPLWILLLHIGVTFVGYAFGKFTCKVCIQGVSFAIPISIAVPLTVSTLWTLKNLSLEDKCQLTEWFSPWQYMFWNMGTLDTLGSFQYEKMFGDAHGWLNAFVPVVWFACLVSQITSTLHIWKETSERLASTELLFVNPMYNAAMLDQSLALNRRSIKIVYSGEQFELEQQSHRHQQRPQQQQQPQQKSKIDIEAFAVESMKKSAANHILLDANNNNNNNDEEKEKDQSDIQLRRRNPLYSSINTAIPQKSHFYFDSTTTTTSTTNPIMIEAEPDWEREWARICAEQGIEPDSIDPKPDPKDDDTIRIFACATMWHEDKNEMLQMLKAIMRLDKDQWARRKAREEFPDEDTQYYEIETNIFFDDAYEQGKGDDEDDRVINRFVEQLINVMNEAANHVLEMNVFIEFPTIVPTPYGGKLIWRLPGENRLIAHVKDKNLIRHRKRWSQCMYMYYLLGYRLAARKDLSEQRKRKIANNTFVLALDGDINFQPDAVHMVVDLMKKNSKLGAACGRIHPIGGGPVVWYQKFEYAVGHWLQKATEHVFGCVLCSPGCFSLFRARAVMDKSVMHRYTTKPTEALHYVQYDQGEDRWLCTLMLQRGWRIEYCAASDSYTHAPEGFGEFYTQRRRWAPSTMANIMDLLGDYKQTVEVNPNISLLYIFYQAFLMVGTILSPGNIFLMVVSAMNTAMNFDSQTSLICNIVPVLLFTFVCLYFEDNNIKINLAMLLSLIYALLMLAVLVGTGIDMYQQGPLSPNALFFSAMMGSFVVAAIIHPQEFSCIIPLPIYMLLIPSMYMLLTIYSVTNMHVVSWGTREVKSKLSAKELAAEKAEEEARAAEAAAAAAKKSIFSQYMDLSKYGGGSKNGLFTCMCCTGSSSGGTSGTQHDHSVKISEIHANVSEMKVLVNQIQSQASLNAVATAIRRQSLLQMGSTGSDTPRDSITPSIENTPNVLEALQEAANENDASQSGEDTTTTGKISNDGDDRAASKKPRWVRNNKRLDSFRCIDAHPRELVFWRKMIDKYLLPLDEDAKEKRRIQTELEDLRNKMVFAFSFINIIFILFVFMFQMHKDIFGINIPVGISGYNRTFDEEEGKWNIEPIVGYTRMDPIGLCLVAFFGSILIIQLIGMFIHRFGTLAHLLAYTRIEIFKREKENLAGSEWVKKLIQMSAANNRKRNAVAAGEEAGDETPPDSGSTAGDDDDGHDEQQEGGPSTTLGPGATSVKRGPVGTCGPGDFARIPASPSSASSSASSAPQRIQRLDDLLKKQMKKFENPAEIDRLPSLMRKNTVKAISRQRDRRQQRNGSITSVDSHQMSYTSGSSRPAISPPRPVSGLFTAGTAAAAASIQSSASDAARYSGSIQQLARARARTSNMTPPVVNSIAIEMPNQNANANTITKMENIGESSRL